MTRILCASFLAGLLLLGAASGLRGEEAVAEQKEAGKESEIRSEDRQVIQLMELLQMMELLRDMELLEEEFERVSEEKKR